MQQGTQETDLLKELDLGLDSPSNGEVWSVIVLKDTKHEEQYEAPCEGEEEVTFLRREGTTWRRGRSEGP